MTRLLLAACLLVLLSACAPAGAPMPAYDPYKAVELGEFAAAQGRAAIQATSAAENASLLRQTEIAAEVRLIQAREAEAQAQHDRAMEATLIPLTPTAQAAMTATAGVATATAYAPTQESIVMQVEQDRKDAEHAQKSWWLWPVAFPAAVSVTLILIGWGVRTGFIRWVDWRIEKERLELMVRETLEGPVRLMLDTETGEEYYEPMRGSFPATRRMTHTMTDFKSAPPVQSPNSATVESPTDRNLALQLIRDSMDLYEPEGNRVAACNSGETTLGPNDWKKAITWLRENEFIKTREGAPTYVNGNHGTLQRVYHQMVAPSPTLRERVKVE